MATSAAPTVARVKSLTHWSHFFHGQSGIFRGPASQGRNIEHLDIDVRFVDPPIAGESTTCSVPVILPSVVIVTLRAGQDQDDPQRLSCLVEVLEALEPCEVRWLANADGCAPSRSHFVHPLIVELGRKWTSKKNLNRLVIQGGFPCLGDTEFHFGRQMVFAFQSWPSARMEWNLEGYITNGALAVTNSYLQSLVCATPATLCHKPGAIAFATKHSDVAVRLRDVLKVSPVRGDIMEWMQDAAFLINNGCASRIWFEEPESQNRLLARLRAELLVAQDYPIIPPPHMPELDPDSNRTP